MPQLEHVNPNGTRFKVYQMKDLMIRYIIALMGKRVSISYGLKEP
jgi:hypothetical protein